VAANYLLAEIGGDQSRFSSVSMLLLEARLVPVTRASGKVARIRFRGACYTRPRHTFTWWAYILKRIDPATG